MMIIRLSQKEDLQQIMSIYAYARKQMMCSGNAKQWGNDKPSLETIQEDIDKRQSFVLINQACICGVFAFIIGDDPTYQVIEGGSWLNDAPYGTIHRIAANGQVNGIFAAALAFCENKIQNIRIDTHADNQIMQHLLKKHGFQQCGCIYVEDKTQRIAYQKICSRH